MLTGIGLRNFKAFGNEMQEAPLSKITLIYGPNSGGKSSIIQALLLLKQSVKADYAGFGENVHSRRLIPRGELADLGSFQSLIHRHEPRELGMILKFRDSEPLLNGAANKIGMLFKEYGGSACLSRINYEISTYDNRVLLDAVVEGESPGPFPSRGPVRYGSRAPSKWDALLNVLDAKTRKTLYVTVGDFLPVLALNELGHVREQVLAQSQRQYSLRRALRRAERAQQLLERREALERRAQPLEIPPGDPESREISYEEMDLSAEQIIALTPENIPDQYERHLKWINYLGPMRSAPERLYSLVDVEDETTGIQGEYSANVLHRNPRARRQAKYWLRKLGIPYELEVIRLGEASLAGEHITIALYLLDGQNNRIKDDEGEDVRVTLADVGYGVNQLLPVIIEGLASPQFSILCVEQPEIHLHPRLQANIADLMIDTVADEPGKRKQWIVETHSELLILRLQRRIREGKIKPEDISVLYVDPNDNSVEGSAIKVLRLGEDSYFKDSWPDGFFDEGLRERLPDDDELEGADDDTNILDKLFSE